MRVYTIHTARDGALAKDAVFVKEGFAWPALFFGPFWAVWKGLWLVALGIVLAHVLLNAIVWAAGLSEGASQIFFFGLVVITGFVANDLRRWTLRRRGYVLSDVVLASTREEALLRHLSHAA